MIKRHFEGSVLHSSIPICFQSQEQQETFVAELKKKEKEKKTSENIPSLVFFTIFLLLSLFTEIYYFLKSREFSGLSMSKFNCLHGYTLN